MVEWVKAVFKQFGGGGHGSGLSDDAELHQHQKLEKLYISTRAAKVLYLKKLLNFFGILIDLDTYTFFISSITKEILFVAWKVI